MSEQPTRADLARWLMQASDALDEKALLIAEGFEEQDPARAAIYSWLKQAIEYRQRAAHTRAWAWHLLALDQEEAARHAAGEAQ